jgi:hypothetical protein
MRRAVVATIVVLALVAPLHAQQGPIANQGQQQVVRFLGLDEQQVTKWNELLDARGQAVKALRDQIKGLEEQLRAELAKATPDAAVVGGLVIQIKGLRDQIEPANQAYLDGFEAMLTEEQAGKLGAVRRAARLEPLLPAFRLFGLVPPPEVIPQKS